MTFSSVSCRYPFKIFLTGITTFTLVIILTILTACSSSSSGQPAVKNSGKNLGVPVTTGTAVLKTVPVELRAIGNVQAYSTVNVKAQIGGTLIHVYFKEGQKIKNGDLLFMIDPRPYEVQLKQAKANLAKDKAQAEYAHKESLRYDDLLKKELVSQEQYDQIRTSAETLEAAILADEAAIENAKLQLEYCSIHSPIDGITGNLLVHEGNLVKANDINLVTINQIRPIYVSFSVPSKDLPEIKKYSASAKLKVKAIIPGRESNPAEGELTFLDNTIDPNSGTIQLKGVFANRDKILWPGQFVNVVLTLTTERGTVVVPTPAIQTGQEGQYIFVVKPDLTVESRPVITGMILDNETVIGKGISPGELVVTDGQLRLVPGTRVEIRENSR